MALWKMETAKGRQIEWRCEWWRERHPHGLIKTVDTTFRVSENEQLLTFTFLFCPPRLIKHPFCPNKVIIHSSSPHLPLFPTKRSNTLFFSSLSDSPEWQDTLLLCPLPPTIIKHRHCPPLYLALLESRLPCCGLTSHGCSCSSEWCLPI